MSVLTESSDHAKHDTEDAADHRLRDDYKHSSKLADQPLKQHQCAGVLDHASAAHLRAKTQDISALHLHTGDQKVPLPLTLERLKIFKRALALFSGTLKVLFGVVRGFPTRHKRGVLGVRLKFLMGRPLSCGIILKAI